MSSNSALRRMIATVILSVTSTSWLGHAVQAAPEEEALLIVKGAQHFSLHRLNTTSKQVSYVVDIVYPERAIGEPQWEQLRETGWTPCRYIDSGQEEASADWVSFGDQTVTPERTIHQHLINWARGNQMIAIALRYYSKMQAESEPDNTEQHVYVTFEDEHGPELAAWLQLNCSK